MARILITGSADGLGQLAANKLINEGHQVVLHARNSKRGQDALAALPEAETVVIGDLSNIEEVKTLANNINSLEKFDAIIHNAGVYRSLGETISTVNVIAPYLLTCLVKKPERLIYMSSGMHMHGHSRVQNLKDHPENVSYSDSKLYVLMMAKAVARKWKEVYTNAVDPGWVPTKMGGAGAPDNLDQGYETQVWLATSTESKALLSGQYFYHQAPTNYNTDSDNEQLQDNLLSICEEITGVSFPE